MGEIKEATNKLSSVEKEQLIDITKAYKDVELHVIIKAIPDDYLWDELMRRDSLMLQKINYIEEVLGVSFDNIHPIPLKAWEDIRSRYDDLKTKFGKIRKGFGK